MIFNVLLIAKSLAGSAAVIKVALAGFTGRAVPFTSTTVLELKFVPVMVTSRARLPGWTTEGDMLFAIGTGLFTVNDLAATGLPPGF